MVCRVYCKYPLYNYFAKGEMNVDWLDRFNAAIDNIENNLDGKIEYS